MKNASLKIRVVVGCAALFCASGLFAQDWPQWRGPNRDNKVTGFTAPATWPATLKAGWKVNVGKSIGSPVLVGDKIYTFTRVGGDEVIASYNAADGKKAWEYKYATAAPSGADKGFPSPRNAPAVGDGKVVAYGVNGQLTCVDAATGKELWKKQPGGVPQFHTSSSPLIVDGKVIVGSVPLVAFDLANGGEKWSYKGSGGAAYGSPVLMTVGGTKQVVANTKTGIAGVSLADGKELWKYAISGRYGTGTAVIDGEKLYYSTDGSNTVGVQIEKSGDKFTAKELWKGPTFAGYNSPTLKDGMLYGISKGKKLACLDAKDGKLVYEGAAAGSEANGVGAVIDVGNFLVALSDDGNLIVFKPGAKYEEVKKYKVADKPWGEPILSKNRIFVKGDNDLQLWTIE